MTWEIIHEDSREHLAEKLAAFVAEEITRAIASRGGARLAVPGGTTPEAFLKYLGALSLQWSKVVVTLTDERCVPFASDDSNARFISETLLAGQASEAHFVPLFDEASDLETHLERLAEQYAKDILPLDICVLGMGNDMHTASLFPKAKGLRQALAPDCRLPIVPIYPASDTPPRLSATANTLKTARQLHLLIVGEEKLAALEKAKATSPDEAPVNAILNMKNMHRVWYAS